MTTATAQRPLTIGQLTCGNGRMGTTKPRRRRQPSRGVETTYSKGALMSDGTHALIPAGGLCGVNDCDRSHYAQGFCNAHWRRWKRSGKPGPVVINSPVGGLCSFGGCGRKHSAKGLCASHYAQQRKGNNLAPLNDRVNPRGRDASGNKRCATCKQWLAPSSFAPVPRNPDGLRHCCINCSRDRAIRKRYGISAEQYDAILTAQGGGCAICHGVNESGRAMAVDHDHRCCPGNRACGRCIRGLLCSNCNMGIGLLQEDPARLASAIEYLKIRRAAP